MTGQLSDERIFVLGKRRVNQRNPSMPIVTGSAVASQVLCFGLCEVICLWELTVHEEESRGIRQYEK